MSDMPKRLGWWVLINDDDGHWYCIPESMKYNFVNMLAVTEDDDEVDFCKTFDKYRIGGSPSSVKFENPKW